MKKSMEILKMVNGLKKEVEDLQAKEMWTEAAQKADELTRSINEYKAAKAVEDADFKSFQKGAARVLAPTVEDKVLRNRVFNKLLLGRQLNEEELSFVNAVGSPGLAEGDDTKGGYLVPTEQLQTLLEFRRALPSLRALTTVIPVHSRSGRMPTLGAETDKLVAFEELNEIQESDYDFSQVSYTIQDYGDIIPVSNTLLADSDFDLMGIIGRRFANKAVNTENSVILALLASVNSTVIKDWKGITKALNQTLDPAIAANASIVTNQAGIEWMDEQVDSQGRPLLSLDLVNPSERRFKGKPVIVVPDTVLSEASAIPFYVGSFSDAIIFFDREQVSVAASAHAGFKQNATLIRAIERFDAKLADADAVTKLTISTSE